MNEPVALWVGDSFTRGEGADVPAERTYPYLVGARLGWRCHVDAQNGTGFVNDGFLAGPGLAPLGGRLAATVRAVPHADLVIVDGGRNDAGLPDHTVRAAASDYLDAVTAAYPAARLVIVLPTLMDAAQPPEYQRISTVLRDLATALRADVIDLAARPGFASPPSADAARLVCWDGFHPSAAGQAHYADHLIAALNDPNVST